MENSNSRLLDIAYPNPTSGKFNLRSSDHRNDALVTIRNIQGQEISSKYFSNAEHLDLEINDADGVYFIEIKSEDQLPVQFKILKVAGF